MDGRVLCACEGGNAIANWRRLYAVIVMVKGNSKCNFRDAIDWDTDDVRRRMALVETPMARRRNPLPSFESNEL